MTSPVAIPETWPKAIAESYLPIRVLGTGGFASVILARKADPPPSVDGNNDGVIDSSNDKSIPKKVAIKVVGCNDGSGNHDAAVLYAQREIELLQQISHVGIVKLFYAWERREQDLDEDEKKEEKRKLSKGTSPTAGVLVLEYLKGPTVEKLLKHGGALSTTFARVVIAQVMDAMAYLHYRAVVHRDMKPDNIMVTGALSSDSFLWDNEDGDDDNRDDEKSPEEWKRLCFKYKATIIDFGFARALTPADMEGGATHETMMKSMRDMKPGYYDRFVEDRDKGDRPKRKSNGGGGGGAAIRKIFSSGSSNSMCELDESIRSIESVSHKMKRVMSTLGNRNYAAPEIVEKVRASTAQEKRESKRASIQQRCSITCNTISNFVADYGLLVDSYSMGYTIRYMMTGVEPGTSVEEAMKKQNRSKKAGKMLKMIGLKKKPDQSRKPRYRSLLDMPGHIFVLVKELTAVSAEKRISIRKARRNYIWISDVLAFQKAGDGDGDRADASTTEKPEVSLARKSEEQFQALGETRYLPLATPNPDSVISVNSNLKPTDGTRRGSSSTSSTSNPVEEEPSMTGLDLEDDMITF